MNTLRLRINIPPSIKITPHTLTRNRIKNKQNITRITRTHSNRPHNNLPTSSNIKRNKHSYSSHQSL